MAATPSSIFKSWPKSKEIVVVPPEYAGDELFSEYADVEKFSDNLESEGIDKVNDDVLEAESFKKFGINKWRFFEYVIVKDFYYKDPSFFRPGWDPRSRRRYMFKNGFFIKTYPLTRKGKGICFSSEARAAEATQFALDSYSGYKRDGEKSLKLLELCYLNAGVSYEEESKGEIYYITFVAMDCYSGNKKEFQASVYLSHKSKTHYLKAFRPKPEGLKLPSCFV